MRVGFTTTIPVEIILAAGGDPVDLNNVFVTSPEAEEYIKMAETNGFPRSVCAWIKGIYGVVAKGISLDAIVMVTEGDCANTRAMMDVFRMENAPPLIPFEYPYDRNRARLEDQMEKLASALGTTMKAAEGVRRGLRPLREKLERLDELTWKKGRVSGGENHAWLVSSSDFNGDPVRFEEKLDAFLDEARARPAGNDFIPLACAGAPPIFSDLYRRLEALGAGVVLNEMPRQFSMPGAHASLADQYLEYRYPYDVFFRLEDLNKQIALRKPRGLIHYVQSFCHRGIEDIALRKETGLPVLTLEGDRPGPVDERTRLRLAAFLEML